MNSGTYYLYEYKNDKKIRNVGFMKLTQHYQSCILQLTLRPIPNFDKLTLALFYNENDHLLSYPLTQLPCQNHAASARLALSESDFPGSLTLKEVDGFLLSSSQGQIYAVSVSGIPFHTAKIRQTSETAEGNTESAENEELTENEKPAENTEPNENAESAENAKLTENAEPAENAELTENTKPAENVELTENAEPTENTKPAENAEADEVSESSEISAPAETPMPAEAAADSEVIHMPAQNKKVFPQESVCDAENSEPQKEPRKNPASSGPTARKILRSELSVLPRKYWNLANNSFLLHSYHNYKHLLLIEEDGQWWLGVPGIYHPREARAAELFGFPQFTKSYTDLLDLNKDECNDTEEFGHWCRWLK